MIELKLGGAPPVIEVAGGKLETSPSGGSAGSKKRRTPRQKAIREVGARSF